MKKRVKKRTFLKTQKIKNNNKNKKMTDLY